MGWVQFPYKQFKTKGKGSFGSHLATVHFWSLMWKNLKFGICFGLLHVALQAWSVPTNGAGGREQENLDIHPWKFPKGVWGWGCVAMPPADWVFLLLPGCRFIHSRLEALTVGLFSWATKILFKYIFILIKNSFYSLQKQMWTGKEKKVKI